MLKHSIYLDKLIGSVPKDAILLLDKLIDFYA